MRMSVLERRLQVLVDQRRFALLEQESRLTGRSVGSIVRAAIDDHFAVDVDAARRAEAAARFLAYPGDPRPGADWDQLKAEYEADLASRFE